MQRNRLATLAVAAASFAAVGGIAYAAGAAGSAGVIQACVKAEDGELRVVADTAACRRSENALSWSVQGPKGDPGVPGGALAFAHVLAGGALDAPRTSPEVLAVTKGLVPGSKIEGFPSAPIPVYCFDLGVTARNIAVTLENTIVQGAPFPGFPPPGPVGLSVAGVNASVDPLVLETLGCSAGAEAAVAIGGVGEGGAPFYVLFN